TASRAGVSGVALVVRLAQSAASVSGLWLLAWLSLPALGRDCAAGEWFRRQLKLAIAGNGVLLGTALALLVVGPVNRPITWLFEAGSPLGLLALATLASAVAFAVLRGQLSVFDQMIGWFGLALATVAASAIYRLSPSAGSRCALFSVSLLSFA